MASEDRAFRYDPALEPADLFAKGLVGRFFVVGHDGLPEREWRRVLFYQYVDGRYRPADEDEVTFPVVAGAPRPTHLLLFDPLTGQRHRAEVLGTRPARREGGT